MKDIKISENEKTFAKVRQGDQLLPRVAPNVSLHAIVTDFRHGDYYGNQSIAYYVDNKGNERLLFGIKSNAASNVWDNRDPIAYIHVTDMNGNKIANKRLNKAYHINDMMISNDNANVMIAPLDGKDERNKSIIREYKYSTIVSPFIPILPIEPVNEIDLSVHFGNVPIDAMCNSKADERYIIKGGNKIVFFDYNFNPKESIVIDQTDMHGDDIWSQTIEYYNGLLLHMNTGNDEAMGSSKNGYLSIFRPDSSKIETYRYPDRLINMEAEGICRIGEGKYFYTHYRDIEIDVRLLDFNTPSHTHRYSDIIDFNKLETGTRALHVNPLLEGKSHLAPDGSPEKPFPNVTEAIAYAKVFQPEAVLHLMDGEYGTIRLSSIPMSLTLKGMNKDACLVDKINIDKCKDLTLENITFCNGETPLAVSASTVEINRCSLPNGRQSGPDATGSDGITIVKDSTVTIQDCEISHFDCAVNISASTLYLEGANALTGTGNRQEIRSELSTIWGAKDYKEKIAISPSNALTGCMPGSGLTEVGDYYFDSQIGKTLWWNGTNWVDATGTECLP